jgi:homoserine kinase type II
MGAREGPAGEARELEALSEAELAALREAYDLGAWLSHRRTPEGSSNVSFFVTTERGRYVLRRSKPSKTEAGLAFELRLIHYLREHGFPAPEPVRARDGSEYVRHGGILYLLTVLIPGDAYDADDPRHLRLAGRGLATYHQLAAGFPCRPDESPPPFLAPILAEGGMTSAPRELERLAARELDGGERSALSAALGRVEERSAVVRAKLLPRYPRLRQLVVHGSFGRSTLLFQGDSLAGVFDYDRATWDLRTLDLAYTLKAFSRVRDKRDPAHRIGLDGRRFADVLRAYLELEPLSTDEIEVLHAVVTGQRLVTIPRKIEAFLAEGGRAPGSEGGVRRLVKTVVREAERLEWLARNGERLVAEAMGAPAPDARAG